MNDFIPEIKIIGIGGAGSNIVSKMGNFINHVELYILDTNQKSLSKHSLKNKILIGKSGIGTGSKSDIGKRAFNESVENIKSLFKDTDLIFLIAGFGGGTGTGVLPEIAKVLKEMGILTLSVITKPFNFEGKIRERIANEGLNNLKNTSDSYLIIDNNKISKLAKSNLTFLEAFSLVDEFISKIIKEIVLILTTPSFINLDFADLKNILKNSGKSVVAIGEGRGNNKIKDVLDTTFSNSLLEDYDISKATKFILNMIISDDVSYEDVQSLVQQLKEKLYYKENTQIIFGVNIDKNLENQIRLTLIASGFDEKIMEIYKNDKILYRNHKVSS
ncbi:cell division protein FtsZ [Hydrogenivirga sp. 128-5-R1-1]|uniref:cell division protein FtsZ n=1 Tax=Hydrogenivirga sp. 128-5-R1-1 TaxID=392423 RepID=UPI00015F1F7F|nr:cell division protein FtsZ [Hydrogenivirga sp. 128-5-R1-1]EDP74295.1 cell division protein FtsZ [Hydrogenivirga sp. 128-5-R1-1]